jgi:hypothetical protein
MDATGMNEQLCTAITRRSLVMFEYGDLIRVVEPHRFGVNSAGHHMLSGWLRAGYSRSDPAGGWRNYLVSEIKALQLLDAPFAGTRPGYAAHDPRMREVFCQLTPSAVDVPVSPPFVVREPMPVAARRSDGPRDTTPPDATPPREARTDDRSDRGV